MQVCEGEFKYAGRERRGVAIRIAGREEREEEFRKCCYQKHHDGEKNLCREERTNRIKPWVN
jgi:hypothetical protein